MRNVFFIVFVFCSLASQGQGFYFGGSVGYGINDKTSRTAHNFDGKWDIEEGNFGTGPTLNLAAGYFLGDLIGVELGAGYFKGREWNKTKAEADSFGAEGFSRPAAKCFYLNPSFVIRGDSYSDVVFYMKIGPLIGLVNEGTYQDRYKYHILGSPDLYVNDRTTYSGRMSYGGTFNAGLDFMLTEQFALFAEVFARVSFWQPIRYSEEIVVTQNSKPVQLPTKTDKNKYDLLSTSAFGLNVGVRYYLFKF
jgi:hypothetical protein